MELLEVMKHRRSVRKYTGEAVSDEAVEMILDAALVSASAKGRRPWSFIVVRDKEMLTKLSESRIEGAAKMLAWASCCIVAVGDSELADTWIEDCSIAMSNMHLMADSLGLGSCWIQMRMRQHSETESSDSYVRGLLEIPENFKVQAILSLGVPAAHPAPVTEIDRENKIHYEKWNGR